jgi:hypothetical protein
MKKWERTFRSGVENYANGVWANAFDVVVRRGCHEQPNLFAWQASNLLSADTEPRLQDFEGIFSWGYQSFCGKWLVYPRFSEKLEILHQDDRDITEQKAHQVFLESNFIVQMVRSNAFLKQLRVGQCPNPIALPSDQEGQLEKLGKSTSRTQVSL